MTEERTKRRRGYRLFFYLGLLCLGGSLLLDANAATEAVRAGLRLCGHSAIPALFPFMIVSELLARSGLSTFLGRIFGAPFEALFRLPREAFGAFCLGLICGFPTGARMALALFDEGKLDKRALERLLLFCNIQSSAFLVSAVGVSLYGDHTFGMILYAANVLGAVLIGLFLGQRSEKHPPSPAVRPHARILDIGVFTDAVSAATTAMLTVCAYILFFAAVIGVWQRILLSLSLPAPCAALVCGLLELTTGTSMASSLDNTHTSILICAFLTGFGGLSVGCQLFAFCRGRALSLRGYFPAKFAHGLLTAGITMLFSYLFDIRIKKGESVSAFSPMVISPKYIHISLILFAVSLVLLAVRGTQNKKAPAKASAFWSW